MLAGPRPRPGDARLRCGRLCNDGRVVAPLPLLKLVLGDEELLASRAVSEIIKTTREVDPDAEVHERAGSDLLPGEVAELLGPSLFGGSKVLVVRGGQDCRKDAATALLTYAADPDPQALLVVTHAGGNKGRALADGLRKAGATVVSAARLTRHRDRVEFVCAEFRRCGGRGRGNDDAAEALIAAVGSDLRELAAACSQLVADTGGQVDAATVAKYYRGRAEVSGFTVADATMVGDIGGALEAVRWAISTGIDPVLIADALADGVRTVARVASAGRGSGQQLASKLGMPPWKVERAQRQARGWTADALVDAMRAAQRCNAAVKGGAEDREYALEQTVFAIIAARARGMG